MKCGTTAVMEVDRLDGRAALRMQYGFFKQLLNL